MEDIRVAKRHGRRVDDCRAGGRHSRNAGKGQNIVSIFLFYEFWDFTFLLFKNYFIFEHNIIALAVKYSALSTNVEHDINPYIFCYFSRFVKSTNLWQANACIFFRLLKTWPVEKYFIEWEKYTLFLFRYGILFVLQVELWEV